MSWLQPVEACLACAECEPVIIYALYGDTRHTQGMPLRVLVVEFAKGLRSMVTRCILTTKQPAASRAMSNGRVRRVCVGLRQRPGARAPVSPCLLTSLVE